MLQGTGFHREIAKTLHQQKGQRDSSRNLTQLFSTNGQLQQSDRLYDESPESNSQEQMYANMMKIKAKELSGKEVIDRLSDESKSRDASLSNNDGETKYRHSKGHVSPSTPWTNRVNRHSQRLGMRYKKS